MIEIDYDRCIACNVCVGVCPDGVFVIREGKPVVVKEDCISCLACVEACPVKAIKVS